MLVTCAGAQTIPLVEQIAGRLTANRDSAPIRTGAIESLAMAPRVREMGRDPVMTQTEARAILAQQLAADRERTYKDLVELVGTNSVLEVRGPSGAEYQIEIEVMWDSPRDKADVRVLGTIDDGRLPWAIVPMCDSFIMAPDGRFIGE